MNEDLNLSDSWLQQKLILMKLNWYQMKDLNTLTINEVFVNWLISRYSIQYMLDKMRHIFWVLLKYTFMAISPLSNYANWCNPKGRFFGGGASKYIYICICAPSMQYLTVFLEYSWLSWIILQYLEHLKFATYQYPSFTLCLRNTERPQKTQPNRSCRTCDIAASWGQPLGRIPVVAVDLSYRCAYLSNIIIHHILPNLNCYLSRPASALSWSK